MTRYDCIRMSELTEFARNLAQRVAAQQEQKAEDQQMEERRAALLVKGIRPFWDHLLSEIKTAVRTFNEQYGHAALSFNHTGVQGQWALAFHGHSWALELNEQARKISVVRESSVPPTGAEQSYSIIVNPDNQLVTITDGKLVGPPEALAEQVLRFIFPQFS